MYQANPNKTTNRRLRDFFGRTGTERGREFESRKYGHNILCRAACTASVSVIAFSSIPSSTSRSVDFASV
jgi:hypothetical protein